MQFSTLDREIKEEGLFVQYMYTIVKDIREF